MWISRHRRVGVHLDQQIHRRVGVHLDQQTQKSWGSFGSADTQKSWNLLDQQGWMSRSHGHQPARMSLNLCRSADMNEFDFMQII
jgi:hypothetical protein